MKHFKHLLFLLSFLLTSFSFVGQDFKIPKLEIGNYTDDKIDLVMIIGENEKNFYALSLFQGGAYSLKETDYFISTIDIASLKIMEHKPVKRLNILDNKEINEFNMIKGVKSLSNGNVLLIFDAIEDNVDYIYGWEYNLETALPVSEPKLLVEIKNKNKDNLIGASFHENNNNKNFAISWANFDSDDKSVTLKAVVFDSTSKEINKLNYKLKDTKNCRGVRNLLINNDGSFYASTVYVSKSRRYEKTEVYSEVILVDNEGTQRNILIELNEGFPTDAKLFVRPDKSFLVSGIYFAETDKGYVGGAYTLVIDDTKDQISLDTKSITKVDFQNLSADDYFDELKPLHLACLSNLKTWKILKTPDGSSYTISKYINDEFNLIDKGLIYDSQFDFLLGEYTSSSYVVTKSDLEGKINWVKVVPVTIYNSPITYIVDNTLHLINSELNRNEAYFNGEESYTRKGKNAPRRKEPPYIFTGNEPIELFVYGPSADKFCYRVTSFNEDSGEMLIGFVDKKDFLMNDKDMSSDYSPECYITKSGQTIFLAKSKKKSVARMSF
jgi:hypothetical protein